MALLKEMELEGQSDQSFDAAIQQGLAEAARRLQGINQIKITHWIADVEHSMIMRYRVTMQIAFAGEQAASGQAPSAHSAQPGATAGLNPGDEAAPGTPGTGENICPTCGGMGQAGGQPCQMCGGTGYVIEGIGGA